MEAKETEKFNKILINGYEELLKVKPENPQAHFIHYLMSTLPQDLRESNPELYQFYLRYKQSLEVQQNENIE